MTVDVLKTIFNIHDECHRISRLWRGFCICGCFLEIDRERAKLIQNHLKQHHRYQFEVDKNLQQQSKRRETNEKKKTNVHYKNAFHFRYIER